MMKQLQFIETIFYVSDQEVSTKFYTKHISSKQKAGQVLNTWKMKNSNIFQKACLPN